MSALGVCMFSIASRQHSTVARLSAGRNTSMNFEDYGKAYKWFSKEILYFGLSEFEMVNSSKELSDKNFSDYSFIFIGGGNTYKLLNELYANDNLEKLVNYLNNNGIIFAGSAGTSIFGKDKVCVGCGATYHIKYNPTKVDGVCDACGEKLILRDDDKPETVQKR